MPAKSRAQFRLMQAVAHGKARKGGPTKAQAKEFVEKTGSYKSLPEKVKKTAKKRKC